MVAMEAINVSYIKKKLLTREVMVAVEDIHVSYIKKKLITREVMVAGRTYSFIIK